jgi:flagellin
LSAAIAALVSGSKLNAASSDIASLSVAGQLQSATSGLKQASSNIAQASSLAQVAGGGIEQLQNLAEQIKTLAQQANSPTLSQENRSGLNDAFKGLVAQFEQVVSTTSFGGKKLLNGNLSGKDSLSLDSLLAQDSSSSESLSIDNLSVDNLLQGASLSSPDSANSVIATISEVISKLTGARASVGSFLESVDYAAASIDSAVANQEAARSTLSDADFADAATNSSQATLQNNVALALAAQGNRLSPALLQLVG